MNDFINNIWYLKVCMHFFYLTKIYKKKFKVRFEKKFEWETFQISKFLYRFFRQLDTLMSEVSCWKNRNKFFFGSAHSYHSVMHTASHANNHCQTVTSMIKKMCSVLWRNVMKKTHTGDCVVHASHATHLNW